jgi:hypothetical protein
MFLDRWFKRLVTFTLLVGVLSVSVAAVFAGGGRPQRISSVARRFSDFSVVPGSSSRLMTSDSGAHMTIKTSDLAPGDAITVWWVVFNNPELCSNPIPDPDGGADISACGEGDLLPYGGDLDIESSALHAAGHIIGGRGKGNFAGYLAVGDDSGALFGPGLLQAKTAEIHLVVRGHGPKIPGLVDDQIHTFDGGCDDNVCGDLQFSIFQQ